MARQSTRWVRWGILSLPACALLFFLSLVATPIHAATLPSGFSETLVTGGLSNPTSFAFAPDGRIFVTQQGGALRVIKNGTLLTQPFVTLTVNSTGERGLLGVAFDPDFANNQFVYVYYTDPNTPIHNRVSRFTADGDMAALNSELHLIDLNNLSGATNHNGGAIHFGPDGKLYVAVGENATPANAQTLNNRLGKILRINSDGTIPTDNPFYNTATNENRAIWAMGLRNPFTFAFQPGTGRMFINDVGQSAWEEINDGIAGSNYGWNICEGTCNPTNPNFRDPLLVYPHTGGAYNGCAIVGAAFYNPVTSQFPSDYAGDYFYADLCGGWIRRYDASANTSTVFAGGINTPVDLHVSDDGALYYLARGTGELWRVTYTAPTATPTASTTNTPTNSLTATATNTASITPTRTATSTATNTPTNTPTSTATTPPTFTPTNTRTNTATRTATQTATRTKTPTRTPTHSATPTATSTRTRTATRTATQTATRTKTPTRTPIHSATPTSTPTRTNTATPSRTRTLTNTATRTRLPTKTPTRTFTPDGPWIWCAHENQRCVFGGTHQVRFGANGKYVIKTFTDGVACTVNKFGDPISGVSKDCHYK